MTPSSPRDDLIHTHPKGDANHVLVSVKAHSSTAKSGKKNEQMTERGSHTVKFNYHNSPLCDAKMPFYPALQREPNCNKDTGPQLGGGPGKMTSYRHAVRTELNSNRSCFLKTETECFWLFGTMINSVNSSSTAVNTVCVTAK